MNSFGITDFNLGNFEKKSQKLREMVKISLEKSGTVRKTNPQKNCTPSYEFLEKRL